MIGLERDVEIGEHAQKMGVKSRSLMMGAEYGAEDPRKIVRGFMPLMPGD